MISAEHFSMMSDTLRFVSQFLLCRARTGALAPSSQRLAQTMAGLAHQHRHARCTLVELGPGTGSITREIGLRHFSEYVAFESNADFVRIFGARFPAHPVHHTAVPAPESESYIGKPCVVVSSIPFRSLAVPERQAVAEHVERMVVSHSDNYLVQYSYLPLPPFTPAHPGLRWRRQGMVACNIPPAFLWLLEHKNSAIRPEATQQPSRSGSIKGCPHKLQSTLLEHAAAFIQKLRSQT